MKRLKEKDRGIEWHKAGRVFWRKRKGRTSGVVAPCMCRCLNYFDIGGSNYSSLAGQTAACGGRVTGPAARLLLCGADSLSPSPLTSTPTLSPGYMTPEAWEQRKKLEYHLHEQSLTCEGQPLLLTLDLLVSRIYTSN